MNYPKSWWLNTSFVASQIPVCQACSHSLAGSPGSGSLHRLPSRCRWGMQSPSDSTGSGATSKFTQMVVGRFQFLAGCWTDSFSSSQAVGCPFHRIAHNTSAQTRERKRRMEARWKSQCFVIEYFFLAVACGIFNLCCDAQDLQCGMQILSFGMWDLVPWLGIEPRPPALGVQSPSHWTSREVPGNC